MNELETYVRELVCWFAENKINYALVGGIAVSFRTIERTTKDVDFAIAVKNDSQAEKQIHALVSKGYKVDALLEQSDSGSIATVRLLKGSYDLIFVDLLFASSGIEQEIVDTAEAIEVFPNLLVNVANLSSLLAMKVLAADDVKRPQDLLDIAALLKEANDKDIEKTTQLLKLITARKYDRKKDLLGDLNRYITQYCS